MSNIKAAIHVDDLIEMAKDLDLLLNPAIQDPFKIKMQIAMVVGRMNYHINEAERKAAEGTES